MDASIKVENCERPKVAQFSLAIRHCRVPLQRVFDAQHQVDTQLEF